MKKSDKGKKVFGAIVILAIIVSVFSGVVSAVDLSGGLKQSVDAAEIRTAVGDLSSEELTNSSALDADPLRQLTTTSGKFCDCCNSGEQFNKRDNVTTRLDGHTLPAEWNYLTTFECPLGEGAFSVYGGRASEHYCAMRWDYSQPGGKEWWYQKKVLIEANDKAIVTSAEDWGPAQWVIDNAIEKCGDGERAIIDVSSPVAQYLFGVSSSGWSECRLVRVSFADQSLPLGPVKANPGCSPYNEQCGSRVDDYYCGKNNPCWCCDNNCDGDCLDGCDGNCCWWAWDRACRLWGVGLPWCGNGGTWADSARSYGYRIRDTPGIGTIADGKSIQHVAWVVSVSEDKTRVTVSEMNCWSTCGTCSNPANPSESVRTREYSASVFEYIYPLTITARSIYSSPASPGDELTFVYKIKNPSDRAVGNIRLGARIRTNSPQGTWIDDPANDKVISVDPGEKDYSRKFRIPSDVSSGYYYDAGWVIVNQNTDEYQVAEAWVDENVMNRILYIRDECPTPGTPSNPSPSNHASDVPINTDLDWSDCSNTDYYDVYVGTSSPPPYYGNAPTSSYPSHLFTLSYNTKYYWKIVAKSNCGGITQGPIWDFTTEEEPNQPPTLISPPDNSHQTSSITFQWSSVSGATNYELSVKFPGSSSWLPDQTASTSYPYSPTLIGEYHWRVRAYVSGSWSDYSDEWIFYFDGAPAPTLISPPNNAEITILRPTFQWNSVPGSISYQLQLARGSSFTDMVRYNLGIASTSWQLDTDLTAGQTYYWRVRSGIPIGFWSTVWHFTVVEPTYPPTVTTNAATLVEETTATLNGVINNDGGEACQYRFEYDTNLGEPYAHNTGWTGSKTTGQSFNAAIPSLNKGTKYYFRAQAKNSAGTASGSELTFLTKPDAPTSFSATTAGTTQIDLSWTKGAGAQKTKIQRKQGSYPENRNDGTQVYFGTGSSTPNTGLNPGTTYYYRAWSYRQGSEQWSDNYAQAFATTTSISSPTVTTNAATNVEETTATLNGVISSDGGEACQYRFEYDTNSGEPYAHNTGWTGSKTTGQSFSASIPSLAKGTKYYFRAQAKNSAGTASGSDMAFTTSEGADTTPPTWGTTIGIQSAIDTCNGGEVTVTYGTATDAVSPPVKYNAYYSTSSPATGGTKVSNVGSSPYTVTGLTNGQLYYFSVRAEDSATPPNEDTNTFELTATPTAALDPTPPSAVTDLATTDPTSNSIKLTWTAPGDDGNTGTATTYDIRYLEGTPITESNWASAIQCTDEPSPNPAGSAEAFVVTGLSPDTYYFALKTADEVPNWSPISNSPRGTIEPGEVSIISIDPSSSNISTDLTTKINLTLDKAPNGLSGYNLTVSLSDVTVAEIVSVSFPSWATLHDNSTLPADSIWMKAADLSDQVKSGATEINLGTLTLRGDNQGTSDIVITVTKMDDDNGYPINPNTISGQIEVTSVIPIPGHTNPPTDPDSDGLYEDLNGNGMKDFDDVVQFFKYMEWIEDNEPIACFDFNGNDLIDFADIVELFKEV